MPKRSCTRILHNSLWHESMRPCLGIGTYFPQVNEAPVRGSIETSGEHRDRLGVEVNEAPVRGSIETHSVSYCTRSATG